MYGNLPLVNEIANLLLMTFNSFFAYLDGINFEKTKYLYVFLFIYNYHICRKRLLCFISYSF